MFYQYNECLHLGELANKAGMCEHSRPRQTLPFASLCLVSECKRLKKSVHAYCVVTLPPVGNTEAQRFSASSWRSIPSLYGSEMRDHRERSESEKKSFQMAQPWNEQSSSDNWAFNPKWTNLHVQFTCRRFTNCLKSETQVITQGLQDGGGCLTKNKCIF